MSLIALLGVLCVLLVVKESVASKTASFKTNIARKYAGAFFALSTPFFVPSSIPRASAIAGVRTVAPDRVQDNTLADQLKVVQALQVERQMDTVRKQEASLKAMAEAEDTIATGIVALPPPAGQGIDASKYPLGYAKAVDLEGVFDADEAALVITAVPREGPPFAAKAYKLKDIDFPFAFDLNTNDLIFPYTAGAWKESALSKDTIAITAILAPNGKLSTPSAQSHFGFALASVKPTLAKVPNRTNPMITGMDLNALNEQPPLLPPLNGKEKVVLIPKPERPEGSLPLRQEARISVSLKADGSEYKKEDLELLTRVDQALEARYGDGKKGLSPLPGSVSK